MKEVEFFKEEIDKATDARQEVLDKKESINLVKKVWPKGVKEGTASEVQTVADMLFWKDGFPEPEDEGKLRKVLDKFIKVFKLMELAGKEQLVTNYLEGNGVVATVKVPLNPEYNNNNNEFLRTYNDAFSGTSPLTNRELFVKLVESTVIQMEDLFELQENEAEIKEKITQKCDLSNSTVNTSVNLSSKKLQGKDISDDKYKLARKNHELEKAIEYI